MSTNTIVVEKNIPLPPRAIPHGGRKPKYPLESMEPGDSFVVGGKPARNIGAALRRRSKALGIQLATRKVGDGVRVWRVA